jgi:hypothetical protein
LCFFQKKRKKPRRPCPFCAEHIGGGKLKRHIQRRHKDLPEVKQAMALPLKRQKEAFAKMRSAGVFSSNLKIVRELESPNLLRERRPRKNLSNADLRVCSNCKTYLSSQSYAKHRMRCDVLADPLKVHIATATNAEDGDQNPRFQEEILAKFRDTECGETCRSDRLIKRVGERHFTLKEPDAGKSCTTRKNVMAEMRMLANLFLTFKKHCPEKH